MTYSKGRSPRSAGERSYNIDVENTYVEPAEFGIRFLARLIDYVPLILALAAGVFLVQAVALLQTTDADVEAELSNAGLMRIAVLLGMTLYHTFAESVAGATLGKRLLGLEVVSIDLQPATLWQGWKRNVGFFIDSLFFGLIGWTQMDRSAIRQRLGDRWGKTRVIRRRSLPLPLQRPTRIFVFVLLGAMAITAESLVVVFLLTHWLSA
jgi:uncharacterized RDD family membrane protein YckC